MEETKKNKNDFLNSSPPNCPVCNGETEWGQKSDGATIAFCYFCGYMFKTEKQLTK